uniref:Uncharacterized protein n=1 Tax=Rhizophora mucronata TaxID=61149 RepID=A0A2P2JFK7_RHIMU
MECKIGNTGSQSLAEIQFSFFSEFDVCSKMLNELAASEFMVFSFY